MNKEIEEFENWFNSNWKYKDNPYHTATMIYAFEAWKAGRNEGRKECANYLEGYATRFNDIRSAALEVAAEHLRAKGQG
jgi:hypothetical protein